MTNDANETPKVDEETGEVVEDGDEEEGEEGDEEEVEEGEEGEEGDEEEGEEGEEEGEVPAAGETVFDKVLGVVRTANPAFPLQHDTESADKFMTRIVKALNDNVSDDEWNELPEAAQNWYNDAVEAVADKKPLPLCPGYVAPVAKETKKVSGAAALSELKRKKEAKAAAKTKGPRQPSKPAKPRTPPPERGTGLTKALRRMVIQNPEITREELRAGIEAAGHQNVKNTTISVVHTDTLMVIRLIKEEGLWKDAS